MKAIDFACRLLARLAADGQPRATQQVLLALAAGLDTGADIARNCGLSAGGCAGILRQLTERKLAQRSDEFRESTYRLTPKGRELIAGYFDFLPRTTPHETPPHHR